jgi:uncharacterized protein
MSGLAQACRTDFEFHPADDAARLAGVTSFDAVVLAKLNVKSPHDSSPWVDEVQEQLIRGFVESGGGLLVIHAGTVGYQSAPMVRALTGGAFQHHPEACSVELTPAAHQLTAGGASFSVYDEHYFVEIDKDVEIFLTSHSIHGVQPAGWVKTAGRGRICTLTPGHESTVWGQESFQGLLHNALSWVVGKAG